MSRREQLRIAVGTFEVSGVVRSLADGFARLGHEVTAAMRLGDEHFEDAEYDLDISRDVERVPFVDFKARLRGARAAPRGLRRGLSPLERLHWLAAHHDVFVFVFGSLYSDHVNGLKFRGFGRDFALLHKLGKRIVCCFMGPDVRHASAFDQEMAWLGRRGARPSLEEAVPAWGRVPVSRPLVNLRRAERWADCILSQPNQAGLALRPYHHLFIPLERAAVRARVPGRERPRVVHAPSLRAVKGTDAILGALERLRGEGVDFELRLLEQMPNHQVMRELSGADVVLDQLHLPLHGRLGVEAMASGCALATRDDTAFEPFPAQRPVWDLDAASLFPRLRRLLTDRELRVRLGHEGIAYARRWHDHVEVARRILACLGGSIAPEHEPTFFARHYRLPEGRRLTAEGLALNAEVARRHGVRLRTAAARGLVRAS